MVHEGPKGEKVLVEGAVVADMSLDGEDVFMAHHNRFLATSPLLHAPELSCRYWREPKLCIATLLGRVLYGGGKSGGVNRVGQSVPVTVLPIQDVKVLSAWNRS